MASKPNTGALFKNDRKESENHPDYAGSCLINGVDMWMNAWIRRKEGAKTYMSVSFRPKPEQAEARAPAKRAHGGVDDDIPF